MKLAPWRSVAETAADLLPEYTVAFFRAGRKALAKGDLETLHQFRISAKRFRYALEMFSSVYGPAFQVRLRELKRLQEVLGELNDVATAQALVSGHPQAALLRKALAARERSLREKLERLWREETDAAGQEAAWVRYFRRAAAPAPSRPRRRNHSPPAQAEPGL